MKEDLVTDVDKIIENIFTIHPIVSKSFLKDLKDKIHLSPGVLYMLRIIYKNDMMTMSEISNKMLIPKPNVTAMVDKLISEKMVERVFDPNDRRTIKIKLTDKGHDDLMYIKQTIGCEMKARIFALGEEKIRLLLDSTQFVHDTLAEIMKDFNPIDCMKEKKCDSKY
jgi:DNA-binding MarR family transcriptional regulator